jgi:hypothetical protein
MWEILCELYRSWSDGWIEKALIILVTSAGILVLALICWGLLYVVDVAWQPIQEQRGQIDGHNYTSAHTQMIIMPIGKAVIPFTQYIPESYSVSVRLDDGRCGSMGCDSEFYCIADGTKVKAQYKVGRVTGHIHIQSLTSM